MMRRGGGWGLDARAALPRRQVGGSPQGQAVTVVADYTLRTRAWLPSAAVVALLGEAGQQLVEWLHRRRLAIVGRP
jgi:hypothetical protein